MIANGPLPGEVERVDFHDVTAASFHESFRVPGWPVVIEGAFPGIDWDLDFLERELGETRFRVAVWLDHSRMRRSQWTGRYQFERLTMGEFAKSIRNGTARERDMYLPRLEVGELGLASTVRQRLAVLGWRCNMRRRAETDVLLWMGPSGHIEPLHMDLGDTTLTQLHGSKSVVLFPPSQTRNLYPFPLLSHISPQASQVYLDAPDYEQFPGLREAMRHRLEVTIGPGDTLFIPINWWHEVTGLGTSYTCSINRLWHVRPFSRNFCTSRSSALYPLDTLRIRPAADRLRRKLLTAMGKSLPPG